MRYYLTATILAVVAVKSLALPAFPYVNHVIHEKRDAIERKWSRGSSVDPDHVLPVRIGLKQSNLDKGMDYLLEVYVKSPLPV